MVELTRKEKEEVPERRSPRPQVIYESIRTEGEHELQRPASALAWSGLAAGLSMGFSLVAMGLARASLPSAPWTKLLVSFGYCIGFVIVIVARQQLFTENTLTPIIPLLQSKDRRTFGRVLRLWVIVGATNLAGTLAFAFVIGRSHIFSPETKDAFAALSRHAMSIGFLDHLVRGVFAGWLIALMIWMLPGATSRAFVVVLLTYLIGLGDLSHVVAGSTEAFYALFDGDASIADCIFRFLVPVGLGNIIGGIALAAALGHAQVAADEKN